MKIYNSQPEQPFTVPLEFETSPTFGVLYRRIRDIMLEREAELNRQKVLNPVLFRQVKELKDMMRLVRSAFEKVGYPKETQSEDSENR